MIIANLLLLILLGSGKGPAVRYVHPVGLAKSPRYSHVAVVDRGKLVFISGQVSQDAEGKVVGAGDMAAQTRKAFENLKLALAAAGAGPKDVVKLTTYIVDFSAIDAHREARQDFFKGLPAPPTSTLVGVTRLAQPDYLVEVEAVAVVP